MTQAQWYEKLTSFIPSHYFCEEDIEKIDAIYQGLAIVLEMTNGVLDDHFAETFICQAVEGYLDEHGLERNLTKETGETNLAFSNRIKNFINSTTCREIKRVVDALLDVGEATIVEDFSGQVFLSRDVYYNRGSILLTEIMNTFSIIVDNQVHEPYSFYDREYFMYREDFIGRLESSFELFELIVKAVNTNKACGTLYRLIERAG